MTKTQNNIPAKISDFTVLRFYNTRWKHLMMPYCFLAHLRGAYTTMWHPSSISRARYVTAGAIDAKLCAYVPLQIFVIGISNKDTWHNTRVFDLTDQSSKWHWLLLARFVTIWPRTLYPCVIMYLGTIYISTKFQPDRTSNLAARQPSWKTNKVLLLLTNGWIISKFLSYGRYIQAYIACYVLLVHLIRIHDMIPGFLIWPLFWRSQRSKFKTVLLLARFITIWPRTFKPCVNMYLGTIYIFPRLALL
jgi:hypothetical protein